MTRLKAAILGVVLLAFGLFAWPATTVAGAETAAANLIFIHHSVGSDWLSRSLCAALNASGYHVADTNYGWTGGGGYDYGSSTNTGHWPTWFTDTVMNLVYPWMGLSAGSNTLDPAPGGNTIVMFKSCFPNSEVGDDITDEQAIYNSLLPYFQAHPEKMFVLITPPPEQYLDYPLNTRELCNWLTDRDTGWLKDLTTGNVFVFDFYNVLTDPGAHHYMSGGVETHTVVPGANTLYYDSSGDDHPNAAGDAKAAAEFVPLLNAWYEKFRGPTRYQQEDTNLERVGSWYTTSTWSASGGSFTSVDGPGSAMNVTFTAPADGGYLAWYAKTGPGYGKAQVTLDAGTPDEVTTTVDLYSSYDRYKRQVYGTGALAAGPHTLSIYWTGQKNSRAWGTKIDVDAFDILGTLTAAPTPPPILWRYQQNDPRVTYLGNWSTTSTWSASGGSLYSTGTTGAAALVNFKGTEVKLYAKTAPWYGYARVALDGDWSTAQLVDFYSPTTLYKQVVYTKTGLSPGAHTLAIKCIGDKQAASSGLSISLDAIDTGYLTQAPVPTRFQQDNAALAYTGAWTTSGTTWSASGGNYVTVNATGAQLTVNFTGSYLAWVAKTAPWYGKAQLKLDGGPAFEVDLYSATTGWKKQVYNTGLLNAGPHTLSIQWLGTKNTRSSGTTISVDAFDILGTI